MHTLITNRLGSVVQISICISRIDPLHVILIANTHLFYHGKAGFVRLLQVINR